MHVQQRMLYALRGLVVFHHVASRFHLPATAPSATSASPTTPVITSAATPASVVATATAHTARSTSLRLLCRLLLLHDVHDLVGHSQVFDLFAHDLSAIAH